MRTAAAFGCFAATTFCAVLVVFYSAPAWLLVAGLGFFLVGQAVDPDEGE